MKKKLLFLCFTFAVVIAFTGCGGEDTSPVKVIKQEMLKYPDEGIIVVEGTIQNTGDTPKLVYIYVSIYGDFGMSKGNKKKLMNNGNPMEPGQSLDFSIELPYDEEVQKAKVRVEATEPE